MIQTRYKGDYILSSVTTPWTNERFYPIMTLGMAPLRWWMPPMKMDLRCPSTPATPWQALGVLLPREVLPLGLAMISLECSPPRVSLVVNFLFLVGSEGLDSVSGEWRLAHAIRLHLLNTEERRARTATKRGWAGPNGPAGLGLSGLGFGPTFSTVHLLHFGSLAPSIVGFGRLYLRNQVEGFLCMNFQPFHLGPREFSIQAHWSLPPLEASSHMFGAP
jgi:hypothetical protein